jgi:hypothetical protein
MLRRLRNAAVALRQGAYGVTVEVAALMAMFAIAALIAFLLSQFV